MLISRRGFLFSLFSLSILSALPSWGKVKNYFKPRKRNFRYAVNLNMWFRGNFADRLREAKNLGFDAVEMWEYAGLDMDMIAQTLEELELDLIQFTAWDFGKELNHPQKSSKRFVDAIERACILAGKLRGCEMFTVVVGDVIEGFSREEMHRAASEKIRLCVPILQKYQKTIILEPMNPYNHPNHSFYGSEEGISLCESINSKWVKLNWDFFHMQRFEGNLIHHLKKGWKHIGYLQIADSPSREEPGTGEIYYPAVLREAQRLGYRLPIGLECWPSLEDKQKVLQSIYAMDSDISKIS